MTISRPEYKFEWLPLVEKALSLWYLETRTENEHGEAPFKMKAIVTVILLLLVAPLTLHGGEFRVTPIRLDFDVRAKSGVVTVVNEGDERLNLQMRASEWTQDAEGKDVYNETNDLIFFPRLMTLDKKEERVIRVGIKIPATTKEKTYRLFIEEIPGARKAEGASVAIAIRFGVPIFAKPVKEDVRGEIEKMELSGGSFNLLLKNRGNAHFIVQSIHLKGRNHAGQDVFSKELAGWYLLSGVSRLYSTSIPPETCRELGTLEVEIKTDRFALSRKLDVHEAMCTPY